MAEASHVSWAETLVNTFTSFVIADSGTADSRNESAAAISTPANAGGPGDVVIAFMGITGSGKSSFVKALTGETDIVIGHGLKSTTQNITSYRLIIDSINFVLVDTPGFNDTTRDENDILREIAAWLSSTYREGFKLTGIVYLHPIHEVRMEGSSLLNLRTFRKLCGSQTFEHVALCTTFWDLVDEKTGADRERELCGTPDFWGGMKSRGSRVLRIKDYAQSKNILLEMASKPPITLDIQKELVDGGLSLEETEASKTVNSELAKLKADHDKKMVQAEQNKRSKLKKRDEENKQKAKAQAENLAAVRKQQAVLDAEHKKEAERLKKIVADRERQVKLEEKKKEEERKRIREEARRREEEKKRVAEQIRLEEAKLAETQKAQEEANRRLRSRAVRSTFRVHVNLLDRAQRQGTVTALLWKNSAQSPGYFKWCDCCLQPLLSEMHYHCAPCQFDICASCWNLNRTCESGSSHSPRLILSDDSQYCARLRSRVAVLDCDKCGDNINGLYFHCCLCHNDNYDICLKCVSTQKKCLGLFHRLHPAVFWPAHLNS